jgi:hypothetical protein
VTDRWDRAIHYPPPCCSDPRLLLLLLSQLHFPTAGARDSCESLVFSLLYYRAEMCAVVPLKGLRFCRPRLSPLWLTQKPVDSSFYFRQFSLHCPVFTLHSHTHIHTQSGCWPNTPIDSIHTHTHTHPLFSFILSLARAGYIRCYSARPTVTHTIPLLPVGQWRGNRQCRIYNTRPFLL